MKVYLKNIIHAAIERGVSNGYSEAINKYHDSQIKRKVKKSEWNAPEHKDTVKLIMTNVWNVLNHVVDFTDEGDSEEVHSRNKGPTIIRGFQAASVEEHVEDDE